jgi:hypothetical protein
VNDSTQSILLTLAEISIAYVGFAAIVGALSTSVEEWSTDLRILFRSMIETGLMTLFICVVPGVVSLFSLPETNLWMLSSAFAAALIVFAMITRLVQVRKTIGTPLRVAKIVLIPVMTLSVLLMLVNSLLLREAGPYTFVVLLCLLLCTVQFLAVTYRLFPLVRK